jgi:NAD(P)-dependent dehydrogenase (short-subunit alcohol dehydrogenase family)
MVGEAFAHAAVDAVARDDQVAALEGREVVDVVFEHDLDPELLRALLEEQQKGTARAATEAVAADPPHVPFEVDLDVVPVGERVGDRPVARQVARLEGLQRLVGEDDAEAERVVGPVALVDRDPRVGPTRFDQDGRVQPRRAAAEDRDLHDPVESTDRGRARPVQAGSRRTAAASVERLGERAPERGAGNGRNTQRGQGRRRPGLPVFGVAARARKQADSTARLPAVRADTQDGASPKSRAAASGFAIVTGGTRGIGLAIAQALADAGHAVGLIARDTERGAEAAERLGPAARFASADVTDGEAVGKAIAALGEAHGRAPTILVNNAGSARSAPFHRSDAALFRSQFELNLVSAVHAIQAVLPGMRDAGFGRIVNVASTAALKGYAYTSAYCASKHALLGLTRALAVETTGTGVTVNAVCPGYVRTEMVERSAAAIAAKTGKHEDQVLRQMASANPEGRFVEPEEVADTVLWLVGPHASAIHGQAIAVAGGEVM